jgi:hypothetical protein
MLQPRYRRSRGLVQLQPQAPRNGGAAAAPQDHHEQGEEEAPGGRFCMCCFVGVGRKKSISNQQGRLTRRSRTRTVLHGLGSNPWGRRVHHCAQMDMRPLVQSPNPSGEKLLRVLKCISLFNQPTQMQQIEWKLLKWFCWQMRIPTWPNLCPHIWCSTSSAIWQPRRTFDTCDINSLLGPARRAACLEQHGEHSLPGLHRTSALHLFLDLGLKRCMEIRPFGCLSGLHQLLHWCGMHCEVHQEA